MNGENECVKYPDTEKVYPASGALLGRFFGFRSRAHSREAYRRHRGRVAEIAAPVAASDMRRRWWVKRRHRRCGRCTPRCARRCATRMSTHHELRRDRSPDRSRDRIKIGSLPDADSLRQSEQAWTKWAGSLHISHMHRVVNVYNVSDRPMCLFRKTFKVIISEQRCGDSTVNVEERSGSSRLLRTVSPERIA